MGIGRRASHWAADESWPRACQSEMMGFPMREDRRRYDRYEIELSVNVKTRGRVRGAKAVNVSRHGALIVGRRLPSTDSLELEFALPGGSTVDMRATVAWWERGEDEEIGIGVDFFQLSRIAKDDWDAFIQQLSEDKIRDRLRSMEVKRSEEEQRGRQHPRHESCFMVRMPGHQEIRDLYTRDISAGGMFLRMPNVGDIGEQVELILLHPETDEEFELTGRVARIVTGPTIEDRGIGIAFDTLAPLKQAALAAFVERGINYLASAAKSRSERIAILEKVVETLPDSAMPLASLGQALLDDLEAGFAVDFFRRALEVDPECVPAHRGLFKAYTMLGQPDRANEHLHEVRRLEG